jgi:hypothetical protein
MPTLAFARYPAASDEVKPGSCARCHQIVMPLGTTAIDVLPIE